nr:MAG TPA: hypothetical protein [Caudoviricetes sp.]
MLCVRLYFSTFRFAQKNHISFCKSDTFRFAGLISIILAQKQPN